MKKVNYKGLYRLGSQNVAVGGSYGRFSATKRLAVIMG